MSRLTRIGRARSEFSFSNQATVISGVSVYLNPEQAAVAFKVVTRPAFLSCAEALLLKRFAGHGVRARVIAERTTPGPHLGTPSRRLRLTLAVTVRRRRFRYDYDTIALQVDRALGAVSYLGYGEPKRFVDGAARTVASRL